VTAALAPESLLVERTQGRVEGVLPSWLLEAYDGDLDAVEDRLGRLTLELDRSVLPIDEDVFDQIRHRSGALDSLCAPLARGLESQILREDGRRLLLERVGLASDLKDDLHRGQLRPEQGRVR